MYKDKDKQREVQRDWVRQKREKAKGSTTIQYTKTRGIDLDVYLGRLSEDIKRRFDAVISRKNSRRDVA